MIADRMILVAARRGRRDHRFERSSPSLHVVCMWKSPRRSASFDQLRNRAGQGEIDLVETAAQFGRNVLHAERRIHAVFVGTRGHVAALEIEDAVLAHAQALAQTACSRSLMLCSREPVKCCSRLP